MPCYALKSFIDDSSILGMEAWFGLCICAYLRHTSPAQKLPWVPSPVSAYFAATMWQQNRKVQMNMAELLGINWHQFDCHILRAWNKLRKALMRMARNGGSACDHVTYVTEILLRFDLPCTRPMNQIRGFETDTKDRWTGRQVVINACDF